MAKFVTINDNEMINAEHIVGFGLDTGNGYPSLTVSLDNNVCITIDDRYRIKRFLEDLFYHFYPGTQPDTYTKIYRQFLKMINGEEQNTQ